MLEIKDKPRLKKRLSNKFTSKFPKSLDDTMTKPKTKKGKSGNLPSENPTYTKCYMGHVIKFLVATSNCFGCAKHCHKVRYCPYLKGKDKGSRQSSNSNVDASKRFTFLLAILGVNKRVLPK